MCAGKPGAKGTRRCARSEYCLEGSGGEAGKAGEILEYGRGQLGQRAQGALLKALTGQEQQPRKAWWNHRWDFSRKTGTPSLAGRSDICNHAELLIIKHTTDYEAKGRAPRQAGGEWSRSYSTGKGWG